MQQFSEHPVQFFTAVCYDWLKLLESGQSKQIIMDALRYLVKAGQVKVVLSSCPNCIHPSMECANGFKLFKKCSIVPFYHLKSKGHFNCRICNHACYNSLITLLSYC